MIQEAAKLMSPAEAATRIMELEKALRMREEEDAKKNSRFTMLFDDVGTAALQKVAERSGKAMQLFLYVCRHMDPSQGGICVTNEVLAYELKVAANNIPRIVKVLKECGVMWTMKNGPANVYCINPQVAWRASSSGKTYALFNVAVMADAEEFKRAQAEARERALAAHKEMEERSMKNVRARVFKPLPQINLPPPVGPDPAIEAELELAGKVEPKKGPGLKIKRPVKAPQAPKGK